LGRKKVRLEEELRSWEARNEKLWKCLALNLLTVPERNAKEFLEERFDAKFKPPELRSTKAIIEIQKQKFESSKTIK
jgi:hypothetical protein